MGPRTRGEDEAVEEVITEGPASEKVTGEDGFFFCLCSRTFSDVHTHTLISPFFPFAVIFNRFLSCLLEPVVLPHYLLGLLSCIPFHLSYHFTLHPLQQSCDWRTLSNQ